MPDCARVRERFRYDPATGSLVWRTHRRRSWVGRQAGWRDEDGYFCVRLDGCLFQAHRLIWLYVTGAWPSNIIDHRNRNPSDNRWANLRDVAKRLNQENRALPNRNNKAGLLGVSPNGARWAASIVSLRVKHCLGTYDTPQEAHAAYVVAKRELHEGCML